MLFHFSKAFFIGVFIQQLVYGNDFFIDQAPISMGYNPGPHYSMANSVDYHPKKNLFCVTYTQGNKVGLYKINAASEPEMVQCLSNPLADFSEPQHAVFSPDGEKLVVANWTNQTLTIYKKDEKDRFWPRPVAKISSPSSLINHKPHGIAFSPCGKYFAIAYGATSCFGTAVALFSVRGDGLDFELIHLLLGPDELPGTPKGITFSPDGACLLVTFSDANSLVIFALSEDSKSILPTPRQVIQGGETQIFRPEDVKISADEKYCAISNSDQNTVTFYHFDRALNQVTEAKPCNILQNPGACLYFPHGIAFSSDGAFIVVTEFGGINASEEGTITWDSTTKPEESKFNLYRLSK